MKKLAKNLLKNLAILLIKILSSFNSGRFFIDHLTKSIFSSKKKIFHNGTNLSFFTPNRLNFLRASTFPPFRNIVIREKNQNYHVEIKIKKIKRKLNIKYGALKSYK